MRFTWESKIATRLSNILAGIALLMVILFVTVFAAKQHGGNGSSTNQIASTFGNNSPITSVAQSSNVFINNNFGNSTFNISGGINQIGGSNNTQILNPTINFYTIIADSIKDSGLSTRTGENISPVWPALQNTMQASAISIMKRNFELASKQANQAIAIFENCDTNLGVIPLTAEGKSALYLSAATSQDALENNPRLAYDYSKKSASFFTNDINTSMLALTSHNLARKLFKSGDYTNSFELEMESIKNHELNPAFFDKTTMPYAAIDIYNSAGWLAYKIGRLDLAVEYQFKSCKIQQSLDNIRYLYMYLTKIGYKNIALSTNPFSILMNDTNGRVILLK